MRVTYDGEPIDLTPEVIKALIALMRAECTMMRAHEPHLTDCWTWGRCHVGDVSSQTPFRFTYGGDGDEPDDLGVAFAVVVDDEGGTGEEVT